MSDTKAGQGERLYVLRDGNGVLWADEEFHGITPVSHYAATRAADSANLEGNDCGYTLPLVVLGLFNPATERVVPKDAEVIQHEDLVTFIKAILACPPMYSAHLLNELRKLLERGADDLIAQARSGKGIEP